MISKKSPFFAGLSFNERLTVLKFLTEQKRIVYVHFVKGVDEYFEANYPDFYSEYLFNNKRRIVLPVFIKEFKDSEQKIVGSLYERRFGTEHMRELVQFIRPEYPQGFKVVIPFSIIDSIAIY